MSVSVRSSCSYLSLTLIKYCSIAKNVLPQDVMVPPTSFQEPTVSAAVSSVGEGSSSDNVILQHDSYTSNRMREMSKFFLTLSKFYVS